MKIALTKEVKNQFRVIIPWSLFLLSFFIILFLYTRLNSINKDPSQIAQNEIQAIVNKVGKLMILPKDELPTVATITDLEALKEAYKGELFFANAKVGDKILIYVKSGVAILYDPIANKIVESGPINNIDSQRTIKR